MAALKNKFVAVVGMAGSGKTTAALYLQKRSLIYVRFGQITLDELKRRGLAVGEENERKIREELRQKYGMGAFAKLNLSLFEAALAKSHVTGDGLYSWEEYQFLKEKFGDTLIVLAIYASPKTRYHRLLSRKLSKKDQQIIYRPDTPKEARSRDEAEIENSHKAGPIAMADYTIVNEEGKEELFEKIDEFLEKFIYPSTRKPCFSKRG